MASTWFLAVAGVTGDSTVDGHENELEVSGWTWGLSSPQSLSGGGGGAGRPVLADVVVDLASDFGALQLVRNCATGRTAETVSLTGVRDGASAFTYLRYAMQQGQRHVGDRDDR